MNRQEILTFDHMMNIREQHDQICDQATKMFDEYIETQKFDKYNYEHMKDALHDNVYASSYDTEHVYFEHCRGYYQEDDAVIMPLAFVYSQEYRDRLKHECQVKLAEQEQVKKARLAEKNSAAYKQKVAQYEQLKKELGK